MQILKSNVANCYVKNVLLLQYMIKVWIWSELIAIFRHKRSVVVKRGRGKWEQTTLVADLGV